MGGQACVFYGAAQVSKDVDLILLGEEANFERLRSALEQLQAWRIAVPPFDPAALARGHAVHFRCQGGDADGLRIDVMTRLRDLPEFSVLWERRTAVADAAGDEFQLLSVPDLVGAKKTQRPRDWPIIELLVSIHFRENGANPRPDWVQFWLREARTPELLAELFQRFPAEAAALAGCRPLLGLAGTGDDEALRAALDAEARAEQAKDRAYWAPLKAEIEAFRRAERVAAKPQNP